MGRGPSTRIDGGQGLHRVVFSREPIGRVRKRQPISTNATDEVSSRQAVVAIHMA